MAQHQRCSGFVGAHDLVGVELDVFRLASWGTDAERHSTRHTWAGVEDAMSGGESSAWADRDIGCGVL